MNKFQSYLIFAISIWSVGVFGDGDDPLLAAIGTFLICGWISQLENWVEKVR